MEHRLHRPGPMTGPKDRAARTRGFTLVELLVVIGIIAVMAAVTLPNITGFVQASRVRSAQDQVASAVQRARSRAIGLNTQWGVTFVIESPSVYWVHIEDPEPPVPAQPVQSGRQPLNSAAPNRNLSTRYQLDDNVRFAVAAGECPAGAAAGNQSAMRFDRYGVRSFPGTAGAPALTAPTGPVALGILMTTNDADASICLVDIRNGLSRMVTIARGGRVKKG